MDQLIGAVLRVGEEIQILQMLANSGGDSAIVEADGDEIYVVEGRAAGAIEGVAHLALEVAALMNGSVGEAGDEEVGCIDRAFDGAGPILAGEEFAAIHPGVEAGGFEASVELVDGGGVLLRVGEEDGGAAIGDELDAAARAGPKETDAFDLNAVAAFEAALDQARDFVCIRLLNVGHCDGLSIRRISRSGMWAWGRVQTGPGRGVQPVRLYAVVSVCGRRCG